MVRPCSSSTWEVAARRIQSSWLALATTGRMRSCVRGMGGNKQMEGGKEGGEQAKGAREGERKRRTYCLII